MTLTKFDAELEEMEELMEKAAGRRRNVSDEPF